MCLWNTNAPESDKFHWKPCLHQSFWKIGQMISSHRQINCSITVVTSLAMARFFHKEPSPSTYDWKAIPKVKVLNMMVKHQGWGHKVKSVGIHGRDMSQGTIMWNIKVLVHVIQKMQPMLKFSVSKSNIKVKVKRSNLLVPTKGICH
jgi:hypothetical protein